MTAEDVERLEAQDAAERQRLRVRAEKRDAATRARAAYAVTTSIVARWAAAGYTTARLVDGLPRPERGHLPDWQGDGRIRTCATCARREHRSPLPETCPGPWPFDLIHDAVERGVPFGLVEGLPAAGAPVALDGILVKVAAATVAKAA